VHSRNPELRAERIERLTPALSLLLQINWLIVPGLVELCTPHLMHTLVLGSAERHGRPEPNVEVRLAIELRANPLALTAP
jgi:hypothetical protein